MKEKIKKFLKNHAGLKNTVLTIYESLRKTSLLGRLIMLNIFIRPFLRRPKYNKKYKISICGIFKNEAPYLKEWIEYHEMIGIEHFYLYNNNSDDNYQEVLNTYVEKGLVTLIDWPYDQAQMKAYKNFYETYRHETQWVSFLDIDEFFCPRYKDNLYEWLRTKEKYPVLLTYWRMFGTSGKMHHENDKLVIEQYTTCWENLYHCGKCLINTDYDIAKYDSSTHHLTQVLYPLIGRHLKVRVTPANPYGRFVYDPFHFSWITNENSYTIQINHYWSKAWDVYERKRQMTDVFFKENPKKDLKYFYYHEHQNTSTNRVIYRFLVQLKMKMGLSD